MPYVYLTKNQKFVNDLTNNFDILLIKYFINILTIIKTRKLSLNIQSIAYYCLFKALLMQ